jgi:UDP:flavonoid glycosyltransferase YjiC (YdhE family)
VSYDDILPHAAAFVHHGGLGTTHAGVRAACTQLVLPGPVDQILHAEAVARCGAGICYVGPLVADAMGPLLGDLLSTPAYRSRAAVLRDRFAACGGVTRAVDLLVGLASA